MKHKVIIEVGTVVFEFIGNITKFEPDYILMTTTSGDVYIERRHLAFIEFINKIPKQTPIHKTKKVASVDPEHFVKEKIRNHNMENNLTDGIENEFLDDFTDNDEVVKNVMAHVGGKNHPIAQELSLKQAIRGVMSNEELEEDFSMNFGSKTSTPSELILGKHANKKSRID